MSGKPKVVLTDHVWEPLDVEKETTIVDSRSTARVTLVEIAQTLELLRQRRIRAIGTREFPREEAEEAHGLLRQNTLVGRAALIQP